MNILTQPWGQGVTARAKRRGERLPVEMGSAHLCPPPPRPHLSLSLSFLSINAPQPLPPNSEARRSHAPVADIGRRGPPPPSEGI